MTPRFLTAFAHTLRHEGGDTTDTGGRTRYGISQRAYPHENIEAVTVERARELYHRDYWLPLRLDSLADGRVACKVFDIAVNTGVDGGTRIAQRACSLTGHKVKIDGKIGLITIAALNAGDLMRTLGALCVEQARHYERLLIADHRKYGSNERGWMIRAAWIPR